MPKKRKQYQPPRGAEIVMANICKKCPPHLRGLVRRLERGHRSAAIKLFCVQCVGWENDVSAIANCTSFDCPNWLVRPHRDKMDDSCQPKPM